MRDLVVTQNITLDGVIEMDGWSDLSVDRTGDNADLNDALVAQAEAADALLVGRRTFEDMRGFWPQHVSDTTGVTDYLNRVAKYVVSTTLHDPDWAGTTVLRHGVDDVAALKRQDGRDIVTTGSIRLAHALADAGLVDEYRLFVHPVVHGPGRRLFSDGTTPPPALTLAETTPFRSGVVLLRYRVG